MSEAFQDAPKVKLKNGEEVVLPRLTIGKIMGVAKSVQSLVKAAKEEAPEIFELISGKSPENAAAHLVQSLPTLFPLLLDQIVDVLAAYLNKDREWINDNMDMEDLVNIATPFFENILKQGNYLLGPLSGVMQKTVEQSKKNST